MIYFGTKKIYELSSYKGLKYFRQSFLFFALAYFSRSFIKFFLFYFDASKILNISRNASYILISHLTLFIFIYISSIAIFYLAYSLMWKKWRSEKLILTLLHLIAVLFALVILFSNSIAYYILINIAIIVFVSFCIYSSYNGNKIKKRSHKLYIIYFLLSGFWLLNVIEILIPSYLENFQILIYISSLTLFLIMLYKVLKKAGD